MSVAAGDSPLASALERFSIPELWRLLGLSGRPGASCRSPFREDKVPSFAIYAGGRRWCDHGTGEGGDAVDFIAQACDLSKSEAARKLIELAGTRGCGRPRANHRPQSRPASAKSVEEEKARQRRSWPVFETPSRTEIAAIAALRDLSPEGVAIAAERRLLFCATWHGYRAWIVSDGSRLNAQARRMDGGIWEEKDSKAWTLPGSVGGWPVGLREARAFPAIALVEGGPDLLAAFHLAWCETATPETLALGKGIDLSGSFGVVAVFGATIRMIDAALPLFAGKRVRIFAHDDSAGYGGAATWAVHLKAAGAAVDSFGFTGFLQGNGSPVNDLNDFVHIDVDQWETERTLIDSAFDFVPAANPPPL
jgi:hypothetical protein